MDTTGTGDCRLPKDITVHKCKIKKVKMFDTYTYQCGCGRYFSKEKFEKQEHKLGVE